MSEPSGDSNPHRLPRHARPVRYDLVLEPDLGEGTFAGTVSIALEIDQATPELVLNAAELDIDAAELTLADGVTPEVTTSLDATTERLTCTVAGEPLTAGRATLTLTFRGILNDKLRGFYRSRFTDENGTEHTLATTQFESTDARRAFPCFDEPDFKAIFGVTLVVPTELMAISNGAELDRVGAGNGRDRVRFVDTMIMSTYLVAFVVGPLEATAVVDVDGVPLRVVHPLGKASLAQFGLEIGASALRTFASFYGIPYPGGKVDLVAIPDFAFGAMENLGCITFRETALLVDPDSATQPELERVADVVAHELAHMWFGDLVTMKWWNGIWLNEAFATFMEVMAVDRFRPDWTRWSTFALGRSAAFDTDALAATRPIEYPVLSPSDAEGMFDILTYEKGASVVRMLEQYLGEESFRAGIAAYLAEHAYGNTETTDLWDALEAASGRPVRRVADSWILQGGHPLVSVAVEDDGNAVTLRQRLFRYLDTDDQASWSIPIGLRWADADENLHTDDVLLEGPELKVELGGRPQWIVANRGAAGFFRIEYDTELRHALAAHALEALDPTERYTLVDDTWAAVLSGSVEAAAFCELVEQLAGDDDLAVWRRIIGALATLHRVVGEEGRRSFAAFIGSVVRPLADRLGPDRADGEPDQVTNLRAAAFEAMGTLVEDPAVRDRATALLSATLTDPAAVDAALGDAAVRVVAAGADAADFDRFLMASKAATTPQHRLRYLGALADVEEHALFERFLEMLLSDEVRSQDVAQMLNRGLVNRENGARAWDFAAANWDTLIDRLPSNAISRMISGVRTFTDPGLASQVTSFLDAHQVPQAAKAFSQHVERMRVTVALAERERQRLVDAVS